MNARRGVARIRVVYPDRLARVAAWIWDHNEWSAEIRQSRQPTLWRLKKGKSPAITAETFDLLNSALAEHDSELELTYELWTAVMTPGAARLWCEWKDWNARSARADLIRQDVHHEDEVAPAPDAFKRMVEALLERVPPAEGRRIERMAREIEADETLSVDERERIVMSLLRVAAVRYAPEHLSVFGIPSAGVRYVDDGRALETFFLNGSRAGMLRKFYRWLQSHGHAAERGIALVNIFGPLLQSAATGSIERHWSDLTAAELASFVRHGIEREKIRLNRAPVIERAMEIALAQERAAPHIDPALVGRNGQVRPTTPTAKRSRGASRLRASSAD